MPSGSGAARQMQARPRNRARLSGCPRDLQAVRIDSGAHMQVVRATQLLPLVTSGEAMPAAISTSLPAGSAPQLRHGAARMQQICVGPTRRIRPGRGHCRHVHNATEVLRRAAHARANALSAAAAAIIGRT